ncbi:BnaA04g11920D [Brassica napus]|uniref:BnaA04g11920D protein n=1 Tax=Brassica napus TaxID=3708 RepID=A0A078FSM6_BRANA|nr:BnaA04g11920D [Brassica napus]
MVTVENIMFMVVMLVATVEVGSYGGGEGGRAGRGAVDVDQKLEEVISSHGAGGGQVEPEAGKINNYTL